MASTDERLETLEREAREVRTLVARLGAETRMRRGEYRGGVAAIGVLLFLGWLVDQGHMKAAGIAALAATLLGSLAVYFRQLDARHRKEKNSIVPPPP